MKKIRYLFIAVVGLLFYSIILSASYRNIYLSADGGEKRLGFLAQPLKFLAEIPSIVIKSLGKDEFLVSNAKSKDGISFFDKNNLNQYPGLLVSYKDKKFGHKFDLLDINTGEKLKQWYPDNKALYEKAYNPNNPRKSPKGSDLYFMHPLMLKDSSLLFTSQLTSLIARIDKNSDLLWLKNDKNYHHTLEMDGDGNIYTCSLPFRSGKYDFLPSNYDEYSNTLIDDHITLINPETGDEIYDKSVISILVENGYEDLLLYKGQVISDPIHLNDIQPALSDGKFWKKGDLLISCRNISAVFLFRPLTGKILWLKHGPWYNQHDVDFHGGNEIVVYGNNVIRDESVMDRPIKVSEKLFFSNKMSHNEVYIYNFENDSTYTPFHELLKSENVRTITSGRCDILPNGELFVEESNSGRIIIGDSVDKKIEYVKRLDKDHVSRLFWSRIINLN